MWCISGVVHTWCGPHLVWCIQGVVTMWECGGITYYTATTPAELVVAMDVKSLSELLKGTIDPSVR